MDLYWGLGRKGEKAQRPRILGLGLVKSLHLVLALSVLVFMKPWAGNHKKVLSFGNRIIPAVLQPFTTLPDLRLAVFGLRLGAGREGRAGREGKHPKALFWA